MATVVWSSLSLGWDSNFRAHIKGTKTGRSSQGKSRKMQGSNKLPKRGVEVRTSEREGRREGWRREKELLSHYYPSVTGLLGSCYGYRDSRLSVLLTIAHKGGIQLWATMQISLSLSFFLHFLLFYICLHLLLNIHILPSLFLLFPLCFSNFTNSDPAAVPPPSNHCLLLLFAVSILHFIPHSPTLFHHTPTSITVGEKLS